MEVVVLAHDGDVLVVVVATTTVTMKMWRHQDNSTSGEGSSWHGVEERERERERDGIVGLSSFESSTCCSCQDEMVFCENAILSKQSSIHFLFYPTNSKVMTHDAFRVAMTSRYL